MRIAPPSYLNTWSRLGSRAGHGNRAPLLGKLIAPEFPSRGVRQRNASGIGGAVGARRKLLIYLALSRRTRPIPAPVKPRESGRRITLACLMSNRYVPLSSAADLLPCRTGWVFVTASSLSAERGLGWA